ncbi:hypothetical protein S1OALGB6SA_1354 [Olavius algarvensis spirochete endosymbiont]|nr:hypothetical protein S1OALGB6SA_1354 [Olavius algarvensis spirochete endosymbiont]
MIAIFVKRYILLNRGVAKAEIEGFKCDIADANLSLVEVVRISSYEQEKFAGSSVYYAGRSG